MCCTCAARQSSHLTCSNHSCPGNARGFTDNRREKTSNPWRSQLGSGAGRPFARVREEGWVLLARHFLAQEMQRNTCSHASAVQDSTPTQSRAVPGFFNHWTPSRASERTGHGTLQLLEAGFQSYGQHSKPQKRGSVKGSLSSWAFVVWQAWESVAMCCDLATAECPRSSTSCLCHVLSLSSHEHPGRISHLSLLAQDTRPNSFFL